jgi:hypothetical protein
MCFTLPGRPIVKGSGFSGNSQQQQQQPQYFPQEIGRMPQSNMMGMQRMPGGHKIGPQNPMQQQQQQQPPLYMNQQQNMFPQQNRGELFAIFHSVKTELIWLPCFRHANRKQRQQHFAAAASVRPTLHQLDQSGPAAATW